MLRIFPADATPVDTFSLLLWTLSAFSLVFSSSAGPRSGDWLGQSRIFHLFTPKSRRVFMVVVLLDGEWLVDVFVWTWAHRTLSYTSIRSSCCFRQRGIIDKHPMWLPLSIILIKGWFLFHQSTEVCSTNSLLLFLFVGSCELQRDLEPVLELYQIIACCGQSSGNQGFSEQYMFRELNRTVNVLHLHGERQLSTVSDVGSFFCAELMLKRHWDAQQTFSSWVINNVWPLKLRWWNFVLKGL